MRIFKDCIEAISEITRDLFSRGQTVFDPTVQGKLVDREKYEMKELIGYSYSIDSGSEKEDMIRWARKEFGCDITIGWAEAWFLDRISGVPLNPPPSWTLRPDYWKNYLDKDGKFSYTYTERMENLEAVIRAFQENKYRRGCYQSIYESSTDFVNLLQGKRTPCSLGYHFLIRPTLNGDKLHILYFMRSCDLINHLASDVYMAIRLQEYIAEKVEVGLGRFIHTISSLHAYRTDCPPDRRW